jgi:hypothetical protein
LKELIMKKQWLLATVAVASSALAQTTPPQQLPPGLNGVSAQQGLGIPQSMGNPVPIGLFSGTATVPLQASPSSSFPGIVGGGVYGTFGGGTSANAPSGTNPGNFSSSHQTLR